MMNKNIKNAFARIASFALILIVGFSLLVPTAAFASHDKKDDYYFGGYGYSDDYYYDATPVYDSYDYDDYYYDATPVYSSYDYDDYYYDATPVYSSYDYGNYQQPYYDYGGYDYGSYSTPSYSTPSYSTPSYSNPSYSSYNSPSYPSYTSYSSPSYPSYVSNPAATAVSSNVNANSSNSNSNATSNSAAVASNENNNVNNNNNVSNNVNNNNINLVIGTPISATTPSVPRPNPPAPSVPALDAICYISPSSVYVNQDVTFSVNATGGNGSYSYSWNGSDGISSSARTFTGRFFSIGSKTANVTITSGNQSISRSCSVQVTEQYTNNNSNLSLYCVASPNYVTVGQNVQWSAYATGGNGSSNYTYSWNGTDGLSYGNASAVQKSYTNAGVKTANVTVYDSNGRSASASCSATVTGGQTGGSVTVIRDTNQGTPVSGVYLSQVPATGISFNFKVALFALGVLLWSLAAGYMIASKRKLALASSSPVSLSDRALAFKKANMEKRG